MHDILIDVLPLILCGIFFWQLRPIGPLSQMNEAYISKETGNDYRGLFAVVVLFHHLAQRTHSGLLFRSFYDVGYLAVALFFFYSGYGLQKSYMAKKEAYRSHFLIKRLPPVLLPYAAVTFLFWLMNRAAGYRPTVLYILSTILQGEPMVLFSWYIVSILLFYVVFWLLMMICRNHYRRMIAGGCIWYVLYVICCMRADFGCWWYNASPLLIVGMAWAVYEKQILKLISICYSKMTVAVWILFIPLYMLAFSLKDSEAYENRLFLLHIAAAVLFVIGINLFSLKIRIGNPVLRFLGHISLEIYLVQGLLIEGLRNGTVFIESETLWAALVVGGSVILAFLLHALLRPVLQRSAALVRGYQ